MLKRLIDIWLASLSEREFDIPFRLLLEAEGHVAIGHSTIHGLAELGKDIVSQKPTEGLFYFFQTKAGDANPSDWNEMERQIRQMVEVPYVHPNYSVGDPYKPVWVCTGQLSETVRLSLGLENTHYRAEGKPTIDVWDRNVLIEKFGTAFFDLLIADESLAIDYLGLWSHITDYMSDEESLREFFHHHLFDLTVSGERKTKRHLATYTLMLFQISQRYISRDDLYSAIDCAMLGVVQMYEYVIAQNIESGIYRSYLSVVHEFIASLLQDLIDHCLEDEELTVDLLEKDSGPSEIFELPLRIHSLASKIGLSLLSKSLNGEDRTTEAALLLKLLENNPAFCHVLSERQMGTFWITVVSLLNTGHLEEAKAYVSETFEWFMKAHAEGEAGLPDPYQPYQVTVSHFLGVEEPGTSPTEMRMQSFFLPVLLKFVCCLGLRDELALHWRMVSRMVFHEYLPTGAWELFAYRPAAGTMALHGFPVMGSWSGLCERLSEKLSSEVSEFIDLHPQSLLILTLAYPWRAQWREVDRYTR